MKKSALKITLFVLFSTSLLFMNCASSKVESQSEENENVSLAEGENDSQEEQPEVENNSPETSAEKPEKKVKETKEEKQARLAKEKEEKEKAKAEAKKQKEAEKIEKEKQKEQEKIARLQKKDNYTGWIYIPKKNFTATKGDIQLKMRGNAGTFGIYAVPEAGKPRPLITTSDEYGSTFFSLMVGRQEYRLNREAGVTSEARETEYGAQMAYTIKDKAQCVVDFSFMPSIATSSRVDILRVTVYTINLGKTTQAFTVKGVFDTMLGENTLGHFSTAAHSRINTETQYTDMSVEKWIRSSNEKACIQFLLNGRGITNPKSVTLANKDLLSSATWNPVIKEQRSFSSVLAYNNSALAINWKTAYLDPLKTDVITFYISVATDDREPAGKDFLANLYAGKTALPSNLPEKNSFTENVPVPQNVSEEDTATEFHTNMPAVSGDNKLPSTADTDSDLYIPPDSPAAATTSASRASAAIAGIQLATDDDGDLTEYYYNSTYSDQLPVVSPVEEPSSVLTSAQKPDSMPKKVPVTEKQLDPEYIQNLLDRIAELENDPALIDEAEVARMNDELDAILEELRRMQ